MSEPEQPPTGDDRTGERPKKPLTGRQAYNVTTDLVGGVNVRFRDNLFQGIAILICLGLGVLVGWFLPMNQPGGLLIGGLGGLLVGLFGSGIFLMNYRAVQHSRGRHD